MPTKQFEIHHAGKIHLVNVYNGIMGGIEVKVDGNRVLKVDGTDMPAEIEFEMLGQKSILIKTGLWLYHYGELIFRGQRFRAIKR